MFQEIRIQIEGYLLCQGRFYTARTCLSNQREFVLTRGINQFIEDIDEGAWGVSYLLAMYGKTFKLNKHTKNFFIERFDILTDNYKIKPLDFSKCCCYLDEEYYPMFSSRRQTVRALIQKGVNKYQNKSVDEIIDLFELTQERLDRPIYCVGNERFRAMSAIALANMKEVFCFSWLSKKMFHYYENNILPCVEALKKENKFIILPHG